jgi:type I restriction enzyme R subunit
MVFLMRKAPTSRCAVRWWSTDRHDLERQLSQTATLIGQNVLRATSADDLKRQLRQHGPDIVFGMIQKQRVVTPLASGLEPDDLSAAA